MWAKAKRIPVDLYRAYGNLLEDEGSHMAASVAFYMSISFFPLLLVLISVTGLALRYSGWGRDARQRLLELIADRTSPVVADQVGSVLAGVEANAVFGGPVGVVTLLMAAIIVFAQLDYAMGRIFNVPRPADKGIKGFIRRIAIDRFRAFLMLLGIAVFVLMGFILSMGLAVVGTLAADRAPLPPRLWHGVTFMITIALNWALFTLIYRVLPSVQIRWSEAARGALLAAVLWEIGRRLLAAVVIGSKFSVYGVVGAFVAIMLWVFYAMMVLFLGAEYIQLFCESCNQPAQSHAAGDQAK